MPGPLPKDPTIRQRRNKTSTAAQLVGDCAAPRRRTPTLPKRMRQETVMTRLDPLTGEVLDATEAKRRQAEAKETGEPIESLIELHFETKTVEVPWHALTLTWWRDVWKSPMAAEFLDQDVHGLFVLAELVDQFWYSPDSKLAAEIRQQRMCFGLTPIDRRRLQWEVQKVESNERKVNRPDAPSRQRLQGDPRAALYAVS